MTHLVKGRYLWCKDQTILTKQGKENFDKIKWEDYEEEKEMEQAHEKGLSSKENTE